MTKACAYCGEDFTPKRPHALYCSHVCSKKVLYKKNKDTGRYRESQYKADLLRLYGLTVEDYNGMLEKQNHQCKICGLPAEQHQKRLYVDHCHTSNKVRGLLCSHCNTLLGMAKDDILILQKSISYLEDNK